MRCLNDIPARLKWCRKKLGLTAIAVARKLGLDDPMKYYRREWGENARDLDDFLKIAELLNNEWQNKFSQSAEPLAPVIYPTHAGEEVKEITAAWLLFGKDELYRKMSLEIDELKIKVSELELKNAICEASK